MLARLAGMSKKFRSWKTSQPLIDALHLGAMAWIQEQEIPDVAVLNLPDSTLGGWFNRRMLNSHLWGGISFFEDSGLFPGVKHRNLKSLAALFNEGTQTMEPNGQVEHSRGCSICLTWLGGLRNADEHEVDLETQRMIRLAECERAIRRLYHSGESLPPYERYPFRDGMEDVLSKSLSRQERWVTMTEDNLIAARRRLKMQQKTSQHSLKEYYEWSRTPRISP
jgi:hypothetical protein